jgi:multiple sugar transport system ATP-binding protein
MNVVHGSLEDRHFVTNGAKVETSVSGRVKNAIMGVRPEDCSVAAPSAETLNGKIYTTELIGDHTLVTVDWAADQIAVKAHKDFEGKLGEPIGIVLPSDKLFIFDADTGQRIR